MTKKIPIIVVISISCPPVVIYYNGDTSFIVVVDTAMVTNKTGLSKDEKLDDVPLDNLPVTMRAKL